jgi:hypothetical protein
MNKDELHNEVSDFPTVRQRLSDLSDQTYHHHELGSRGPFGSRLLTNGAIKSISNDLPDHQHDLGVQSGKRDTSRRAVSEFGIRLESCLHSCVTNPSVSQTSWRIFRQTNRLRTSPQRVCPSPFVRHHANRRQCCIADKRKEKRACAEPDGAYP